jgi:thioredoxin-related protein
MRLAIIVIIVVSIFLIVGISIVQKDSLQTPDKSKEIIGKDGAKMVLIPAGEFLKEGL